MGLIAPIIMGVVGAVDLLILANTALTSSFVKNTAAAIANRVAQIAGAIATGIASAAQWVLNIAMLASPLTWIILGILLLVGVIILIATKTEWFSQLWEWIWSKIGEPVKAVWAWISSFLKGQWDAMVAVFNNAKELIVKGFSNMVTSVTTVFQHILAIPGKVKSAFSTVADALTSPFRSAFSSIARFWNNTVGRISFSVPDWVPGVGGNSFSVPNIPTAATGADILRTGVMLVHKGERIVPANKTGFGAQGGSGGMNIIFSFEGDTDTLIAQLIMKLIRQGYITIRSSAITD
jgi:phage-related protein